MKNTDVLNFQETLQYLRISRSCLYKLTASKKIRHFKSGGGRLLFFRRSDLDEWLTATEVKPQEQLEMESANRALRS